MDPNEALRQIRLTIRQMRVEDKPSGGIAQAAFVQHARDLAELVDGLDGWLSRDGFLPADWEAEEDKPQPVEVWVGPNGTAHYRRRRWWVGTKDETVDVVPSARTLCGQRVATGWDRHDDATVTCGVCLKAANTGAHLVTR